jgi:ankyrin repeat protein
MRNRSNDPNTTSVLYALIERRQWVAVARRCETHPQEARLKEQDTAGNTILHWACRSHFPPEYKGYMAEPPRQELYVVEAILRACPELVSIPMSQGAFPLHVACHYNASSDVVRTLVQAYPPAAAMAIHLKALSHYLPLHLLCEEQGETDSIRAVLEVPEGAASTKINDARGRNPMSIFDSCGFDNEINPLVKELRRFDRQDVLDAMHNDRPNNRRNEIKLVLERIQRTGFWRKVELLALAEYTQQPISPANNQSLLNQSTTTIVRIFLSLQHCPRFAMEMACILSPNSLMQKDELGDLPLHIATRQLCDELIQKVLQAQPLAASIPDASRALPLQLYTTQRRVRSLKPLVRNLILAYPPAVRHLNLDYRLYPLLWSRMNSRWKREEQTALFLMIQSCPDIFTVSK